MQKVILFIVVTFILTASSAYAGAGHDHGTAHKINQEQAAEQATKMVDKLVQAGKLENSWAEVKPVEVQQKTYNNSPEWVVTFNNPQAKDQEKENLYVFLSPAGKYLAANFTGK